MIKTEKSDNKHVINKKYIYIVLFVFLAIAVVLFLSLNKKNRNDDYNEYYSKLSYEELESKALNGDTVAIYYLINRTGNENKYSEHMKWCSYLSEIEGNEFVNYIIGLHYYSGLGVDQNYELAFDYNCKALNTRFNNWAEFAIGYMLFWGKGVEANRNNGIWWIQKAAEHKNERAITFMSVYSMSPFDDHVVDYQEAEKWITYYKENFEETDETRLYEGIIAYEESNIEKAYTIFEELSDDNNYYSAFAKDVLSIMYFYGIGVESDEAKAFELIEQIDRLAEEGDQFAKAIKDMDFYIDTSECDSYEKLIEKLFGYINLLYWSNCLKYYDDFSNSLLEYDFDI